MTYAEECVQAEAVVHLECGNRPSMMAIVRFLQYFITHKWRVFVECCRLGIPWYGVFHDLSKLRSPERYWFVKYFDFIWTGNKWPTWFLDGFRLAMEYHALHNKHHWKYWLGCHPGSAKPMPSTYRREMFADWIAKGMDPDCIPANVWYEKQKKAQSIILHPDTAAWMDNQLGG